MVTVSSVLCVVFKRTGGKLWNKPWGLPPLSPTQKRNRLKERRLQVLPKPHCTALITSINQQLTRYVLQQSVVSILKLAAASEPLKPAMTQQGS